MWCAAPSEEIQPPFVSNSLCVNFAPGHVDHYFMEVVYESFLWDLSDQEVQRICFTDIYPYEMSLLCACVDKFIDFTALGPAVNCHCMMILGLSVLYRFNRKAGTRRKHCGGSFSSLLHTPTSYIIIRRIPDFFLGIKGRLLWLLKTARSLPFFSQFPLFQLSWILSCFQQLLQNLCSVIRIWPIWVWFSMTLRKSCALWYV